MEPPDRRSDPQPQLAAPQGASIADRIKVRLKELHMVPLELGRRVSPTRPGNVYDWIGSARKPPRQSPDLSTLRAIARELKMTSDELLGIAAGQEPPFAAWGEFLLRLEAKRDALTAAERRKLVSIAFDDDEEPDVTTYELALTVFRSTVKKKAI